jgi:hypothetical protein
MPRDDLQDGANDIANEAEQNGLLAAELVTQREGKDGSAESTELDTGQICGLVCVLGRQPTEKQLEVMPEMLACLVSGK